MRSSNIYTRGRYIPDGRANGKYRHNAKMAALGCLAAGHSHIESCRRCGEGY